MSEVNQFINMDHKTGILYIIVAVFAAVAIMKALGYIIDRIGIKTRYQIREEKQQHEIEKLNEDYLQMVSNIKKIKDAVSELSDQLMRLHLEDERSRIRHTRHIILQFADDLRNGWEYSQESYNNIIEMYDEYEKYVRQNNIKNGRMDIAIAYIRDSYEKLYVK